MKNTEIPVVFSNEGMQIMGVLHRPESVPNPPAVVFYHGCTGSKTEAHWLFVKLARHLVQCGVMVLRFDFRFSGESEGSFEDMTLSGEISDGIRAIEFLTGDCGADPRRIGILGLSMGGAVAAVVAGRLKERVRSCVLLNPVAHPFEDLCFLAQARNLDTSRFPIEFISFLFGKNFFDDLGEVHPLMEVQQAACPVLVVNGDADKTISPSRSREYIAALNSNGKPAELFIIEGADHSFSSASWERAVIEKAGEWFGRTL